MSLGSPSKICKQFWLIDSLLPAICRQWKVQQNGIINLTTQTTNEQLAARSNIWQSPMLGLNNAALAEPRKA